MKMELKSAFLFCSVFVLAYGRKILLPECPYGQDGICGGIAGFICREGTECMFQGNYPDAAGLCCIQPQNDCKFGQDGICGGIAGLQCRPGTTCKFMGTFPDAAGKCCIDKPNMYRQKKRYIEHRCRYGQDGICGGIGGLQCREGTTCMFMENYPDAAGKCCWETPGHGGLGKGKGKGQCPSSSGIITTCEFNPSINCLSDDECPAGKLCCPWGCGKVCKTPV